MENIYETFNTIFSTHPLPPKSIFLDIDILESNSNNPDATTDIRLTDIFELLLNMFVYGFKKLKLKFDEDSIFLLKQYFSSVGYKFNIEMEPFDTILFNDIRYLTRYCIIDNKGINSNTEDENEKPYFISNYRKFDRNNLNEFIAVYQYEYESLIFISFDFI